MYAHIVRHNHANLKAVELKFTSSLRIASTASLVATDYQLLKTLMVFFKQIPTGDKSYDTTTKIWTFSEEKFKVVETLLKVNNVKIIEHYSSKLQSLQNLIESKKLSATPIEEPVPAPEAFFHNFNSSPDPVSQELASIKMLPTLLEVSTLPDSYQELRSLYRKQAIKLHPDRNGGDGDALSDLNRYYNHYIREVKKWVPTLNG